MLLFMDHGVARLLHQLSPMGWISSISESLPGSRILKNTAPKNLGSLIATYRYRPLRWREKLVYLVMGLLAVGLPLAVGSTRYIEGYNNHGELAAVTWSRSWFILAIFALICWSLLIVHRLRLADRYIAIHQKGIAIKIQQASALRWEEISGIASGAFQPSLFGMRGDIRYRATIIPNVGKPIAIRGSFENLPECITRLKARLYPILEAALKPLFVEGKWIYFGPVAVQRDALRLYRLQLPWNDVKRVSISKGDLVVELSDQSSKRIAVDQIPNIEILLQLIDQGVTS